MIAATLPRRPDYALPEGDVVQDTTATSDPPCDEIKRERALAREDGYWGGCGKRASVDPHADDVTPSVVDRGDRAYARS